MKWVFYFLNSLAAIIAYSNFASAQTFELNARYNIRNSPNFLSNANLVGDVGPGSVVRVLETKQLASGAKAMRIVIVSSTLVGLISKEAWIYELQPNQYKDVSENSSLSMNPIDTTPYRNSPIKPIAMTEAQASDICTDCAKSAMPAKKNQKDLSSISRSVERSQNQKNEVLPTDPDLVKKVKEYSNSKKVQTAIAYAKSHFRTTHPSGHCYIGVKTTLSKSNLTDSRFIGEEAALSGKETLEQLGWKNLLKLEPYATSIKDPNDAPEGTVLIYSSGKRCKRSQVKDCGHIEFRTDNGYVSDFTSKEAITKDPAYKLVGVMYKLMDGAK